MSRSQEEPLIREWASDLGYRLIKNSRTGRYSLIDEDGDWPLLYDIENRLQEIENETEREAEESARPCAPPSPPPAPVEAPIVIPNADLLERVRRSCGASLRTRSHRHGREPVCLHRARPRPVSASRSSPFERKNMNDHAPKHLNARIVGNDLRPGSLRYALLPDAEKYRLEQAQELLREAGFIEHDDGTWHPADEFGEKS